MQLILSKKIPLSLETLTQRFKTAIITIMTLIKMKQTSTDFFSLTTASWCDIEQILGFKNTTIYPSPSPPPTQSKL